MFFFENLGKHILIRKSIDNDVWKGCHYSLLMVFFQENQELRVFRTPLQADVDDCLLDGKNFGVVRSDFLSQVNHWDGPMEYEGEAEITHHETKGSNHFTQIIGRRRFTISNAHEPALPHSTILRDQIW